MTDQPSEDVYDVAKKAEDWEVGQCPLCNQGYTVCDCPVYDEEVSDG